MSLRAVKVSARSMRLEFHGCEPEYIRTTCHGACCESSTAASGIKVVVHPFELVRIQARGGVVQAGMLQPRPGERRCPFKTTAHLCALHGTPDKPFGCIASPFTLTPRYTLIVRHRYKFLRCHRRADRRLPAYRAFGASLVLLFGPEEAERVTAALDAGAGDLWAAMPAERAAVLLENDGARRGHALAPQLEAAL